MEQIDNAVSEHDILRARLAARYRIEGEYVGASDTARIMGLGRSTVHEQASQGRFPVPHRLVNRKPLFRLDDIVAWMLGCSWPARGPDAPVPPPVRALPDRPTFVHKSAESAHEEACARLGLR